MRKGLVAVVSTITGVIVGSGIAGKIWGDKLKDTGKMSEKHLALFLMMNQWVKLKQEGKSVASYFEKEGYKKIAIYGMSYAGETLLDELEKSSIEVLYGIDEKADALYSDIKIVSMDDDLDDVDAVVVTAISFFDEIEEKLIEKVNCPIISLEDVIYEL